MSTLKVEVVQIDKILPHSDPETISLEIVHIKGWQCVVKKGSFQAGDLCVYFPLDAVIPDRVAEMLNVSKFLSKGRVKPVKLRGEPSYGIVLPLWTVVDVANKLFEKEQPDALYSFNPQLGDDLREELKITKWEPPQEFKSNDIETSHPHFRGYTDIQNLRSYPEIFVDGEEVVFTEKIHGMNARHGLIEGRFVAGSNNCQLKENAQNKFWHVFNDNMKNLLNEFAGNDVIIYGELFGSKIQDLQYGLEKGAVSHRCFDISINGTYLDYDEMVSLCKKHNVETVPLLYRGPFNVDSVLSFSKCMTTLNGGKNMMEGVIIRPVQERSNPKIGRVTLKYVFDQYINRKGGTEKH